jgi:hypothetical protein
MNVQKVWFRMVVLFAFVLIGALFLAGCADRARVGELRTESQSVEVGDSIRFAPRSPSVLATWKCLAGRKNCWKPTSRITSIS